MPVKLVKTMMIVVHLAYQDRIATTVQDFPLTISCYNWFLLGDE